MAKEEGKKSFILYVDYMESFIDLTDEEAGILIKTIFRYCNDEEPEIPQNIKQSFNLIKKDLKRDLDKWRKTIESRSKAGKISAEVRAKKKEQESTNSTCVESVEQNQHKATNSTDNVNVNVNVNVNDNVNNKDISLSKDNDIVHSANELPFADDEYLVFNYWNTANIQHHKTLTTKIHKAIDKALKIYGLQKIQEGILNYARVYLDKNYYFSYKWTLEEFLKQDNALPTFLNDGQKWLAYLNSAQGIKATERDVMNNIDLSDWGI